MKLSTLFIINTIVAILFGLGFVLLPATVLSWYGVTLNDAGLYIARLFGGSLLGFGIISWLVRDSAGSAATTQLRAILLAFFISDVLGFVLSLIYQLQGVANALGWSTVVISLLLGLAFGYYWRQRAAA